MKKRREDKEQKDREVIFFYNLYTKNLVQLNTFHWSISRGRHHNFGEQKLTESCEPITMLGQ